MNPHTPMGPWSQAGFSTLLSLTQVNISGLVLLPNLDVNHSYLSDGLIRRFRSAEKHIRNIQEDPLQTHCKCLCKVWMAGNMISCHCSDVPGESCQQKSHLRIAADTPHFSLLQNDLCLFLTACVQVSDYGYVHLCALVNRNQERASDPWSWNYKRFWVPDVGNQSLVFCKSSRSPWQLNHLSAPFHSYIDFLCLLCKADYPVSHVGWQLLCSQRWPWTSDPFDPSF